MDKSLPGKRGKQKIVYCKAEFFQDKPQLALPGPRKTFMGLK